MGATNTTPLQRPFSPQCHHHHQCHHRPHHRINMREGYHKVELHKVTWEVPEKYKNLAGIGCGAYGQVCSADDTSVQGADGRYLRVAIKKISRPFQSAIHAKRTYRELRMLKHMMGADLNNIIKTQRLSDDHVQFLVYQIVRA